MSTPFSTYLNQLRKTRAQYSVTRETIVNACIERDDLKNMPSVTRSLNRMIDAYDQQINYYTMLDDRYRGFYGVGTTQPAWTN